MHTQFYLLHFFAYAEPRETVNLVPSIRRSSAPEALRVRQTSYVMSQHKRKLRSLAINPTSEQICATR